MTEFLELYLRQWPALLMATAAMMDIKAIYDMNKDDWILIDVLIHIGMAIYLFKR